MCQPLAESSAQADPENTILLVDGIGAYDTISRRAMLQKLLTLPKAKAMLPFVLLSYGQPSQYLWFDDEGKGTIIIVLLLHS